MSSTRRRGAAASSPKSSASKATASTWEEQEEEGRAGFADQVNANGSNIISEASISSDHGGGSKGHHHRRYNRRLLIRQYIINPCQRILGPTSSGGAAMRRHKLQHQKHLTKSERIVQDFGIVATISFVVAASFALVLFRYASILHHSSSLFLPILIRRLDFTTVNDVGGWTAKPYAFPRLSALDPMKEGKEDEYKSDVPDYGNIDYKAVPTDQFYRIIDPNDEQRYEKLMEQRRRQRSKRVSHHWAFDDDELLDPQCRRPAWWSGYYPNCNNFHSYDLAQKYDEDIVGAENHEYDSAYISHGYFREVWLVENHGYEGPDETLALKLFRYKHDMDFKNLETVRKDALVMERLTASPRIVNMYGHCAFSVTVEAIENEMEEFIVPGSGYAEPEDLNDSQDVDPKNHYTVPEKLDIALAMAESIADLHGFKDGVIVHDDIQLCQWLKTRDGVIKLGDFNRAEFMFWDEENDMYCLYNNGKGYGNYRAPEEFDARDLNEQIDVYSMGNNIYGLLTGLWVFYENEDDGVVQEKIIRGDMPFVDDRYRMKSYIEGRLVEIMERCWEYKPRKRADIFEVVKFLRETKAEYDRRVAAGEEEAPPAAVKKI